MKNWIMTLLLLTVGLTIATAQRTVLYKQIDTTQLYLEVYSPAQMEQSHAYPAMIFFFGGGWIGGDRSHFIHHAKYFSQRGLVCFLVDYRTEHQHQTRPFESLKDAKSAIRFIRENAADFGINPTKIIAAGGSAGGHLAAATALVSAYQESTDNSSISCVPNALVLFNPVIDNGPGGYGHERIGAEYKRFSPLHNLKKGAPPTIIFLGTEDTLIPVETMAYYQLVMEKVGSRCDLHLYEGYGHGFFNYRNFDLYKQTIRQADDFLISLGYLNEEPQVKIK
jgi:acetyl esterase/lipase